MICNFCTETATHKVLWISGHTDTLCAAHLAEEQAQDSLGEIAGISRIR